MMNTNTRFVEIAVGVFVAIGIAALFMLAMKVSNLGAYDLDDGYSVKAAFDNIGGLKVQSPVNVSGVRIGRVAAIEYDQDSYQAWVRLSIDSRYSKLPEDTSASIYTAGLLGEQYISLEPGGAEKYLEDGDVIRLTQSALVLEQLIGQFLFSLSDDSGSS